MRISRFKAAGLGLVAFFAGIQFLPVERTNPPVTGEIEAPPEIGIILRRACYDCHSHETRWPWYSRVAPVSWFVADHVAEARSLVNFSRWAEQDSMTRAYNRRLIFERVNAGEMPLPVYLLIHRGARLTREEISLLQEWSTAR